MTIPRQNFGLNTFSGLISKCPPNPDAIKSIVIQQNNLDVVNGATTELEFLLTNFYETVNSASSFSFILPAKGSTSTPYQLQNLNLTNNTKFLCIYPDFGNTAGTTQQFIEWTSFESLNTGTLFDQTPVGPSFSSFTSFNIHDVNCMEFGWGSNISFTGGTGPLWIGTNGGLLKWNGTDMKLWNTLNSSSPSDTINSIAVDSSRNLWIASSNGLSYFNETSGFSKIYNENNSSVLSNQINDIKLLSIDRVISATDMGMSIYNFSSNTWQSFDIYSVPELTCNNILNIAVSDSKIFLGTTGGVFLYDSSSLVWNSTPYNSINTPGWSSSDEIKSLAVKGATVYAGTTGGLVIFPYAGGTAQTIVAGASGPISSNINSMKLVTYGNTDKLYIGHDNGISVLDIYTNTWGFTAGTFDDSSLNDYVNDIIPDFLSGSTSGETIFYGTTGSTMSGLYKILDVSKSFSKVPESNKNTNLLMTYPGVTSLYASLQPLYFLFSKRMNTSSFQNVTALKSELLGTGSTVSGTWTWNISSQAATFIPSSIEKASPYNLNILHGSKGYDNSYLKETLTLGFYTEDIVPELGWNVLGKLMIMSGTNGNYLNNLYLRNPQNFDINVSILVGTI